MLRLGRQADTAKPLFRNRYADEWVGLLVLAAIVLFVSAVVEAGFLRQWLTPEGRIHFVLPQSGVAGLGVGDDIEVMGVHAGQIRRLELNDSGRMYAEGTLEPQFERFVRADSTAIIRHRFVVAGASYIEISRGQGQALDWGFAVLNASVEPNPADVITRTVMDVRSRILPAMDNVQSVTEQIKAITTNMREGKGTAGALLTNDAMFHQVDNALRALTIAIGRIQPLEKQLSEVLARANGTMDNTQAITGDLRSSMPQVRETISSANETLTQIPALITEAEASANSLRKLTDQLRSLWLLGGSRDRSASRHRLPAKEVRP